MVRTRSQAKNKDDNNKTSEDRETQNQPQIETSGADQGLDTVTALICIFGIFTLAFLAVSFVYMKFPKLNNEDMKVLKLPRSMDDAKALGRVLSNYKDEYFSEVILAFTVTYIFLQSFAIPGSIFLSILSGFLFPFPLAIFLVCFCSSCGASFCYLISSIIGQKVVNKFFSKRIAEWKVQIKNHRQDLFSYIIFLRVTPFLPNWFINITSPVLNVPLLQFFFGTFIGVAPPSFGFISAGVELYELTATGDAFSLKSIMVVVVSALISLLPIIYRRALQKKIQ